MEQLYVKTDKGEFIPNGRSYTTMDTATLMNYLDKKFEDQKELFNVKLDGIATRIKAYEDKFEDHCEDNSDKERIETIEKDVKQLRLEFEQLKSEKKEVVWKGVLYIAKKIGAWILVVLGAALLFAIIRPEFWTSILGG